MALSEMWMVSRRVYDILKGMSARGVVVCALFNTCVHMCVCVRLRV